MSELKERIQNELKEAMKAKDAAKRDTLRLLSAALKQTEVDQRKELSDLDITGIIQKEVKRRQEAILDLEKAGRDIAQEQAEMNILNTFLPTQLDKEQVATLARAAIAEAGAQSAKDMGNVMKILMPRVKGQADGKLINDVVRELLS